MTYCIHKLTSLTDLAQCVIKCQKKSVCTSLLRDVIYKRSFYLWESRTSLSSQYAKMWIFLSLAFKVVQMLVYWYTTDFYHLFDELKKRGEIKLTSNESLSVLCRKNSVVMYIFLLNEKMYLCFSFSVSWDS